MSLSLKQLPSSFVVWKQPKWAVEGYWYIPVKLNTRLWHQTSALNFLTLWFSLFGGACFYFFFKECFFLFYDCICFPASGEIAWNPVTRLFITWVHCLFSFPCMSFIYSMCSNIFFIPEAFFKLLVVLAYILNILTEAMKSWPTMSCL